MRLKVVSLPPKVSLFPWWPTGLSRTERFGQFSTSAEAATGFNSAGADFNISRDDSNIGRGRFNIGSGDFNIGKR